MQGTALVDVAIDLTPLDADGAQGEEVGQHAVVLVHGRRAGVHGHRRPGLDGADGVGRQDVPGQQVVEDAVGVGRRHAAPGRAVALDPAHQRHDVGLVDRHPVPAVGREGGDDALDVTHEDVGRARAEPELLAQPPRMAEVEQRDHGSEPAFVAEREDLGVALQRALIELAAPGLEPRPLHREAKGVAAQSGGPVECFGRVAPEITGQARALGPARGLPAPPVVVRLAVAVEAALDLIARGGHTGEEILAQQAGRLGGGVGSIGHSLSLAGPVAPAPTRPLGASAARPGVSGTGGSAAATLQPRRSRPRREPAGRASSPGGRRRRRPHRAQRTARHARP